MALRRSSHEHLHEVDEGKDEAERRHAHEQPLLVPAHFAHVAEHCLKRVAVIVLFFV